jgi:hypothetical protein
MHNTYLIRGLIGPVDLLKKEALMQKNIIPILKGKPELGI